MGNYVNVYSTSGELFQVSAERASHLVLNAAWTKSKPTSNAPAAKVAAPAPTHLGIPATPAHASHVVTAAEIAAEKAVDTDETVTSVAPSPVATPAANPVSALEPATTPTVTTPATAVDPAPVVHTPHADHGVEHVPTIPNETHVPAFVHAHTTESTSEPVAAPVATPEPVVAPVATPVAVVTPAPAPAVVVTPAPVAAPVQPSRPAATPARVTPAGAQVHPAGSPAHGILDMFKRSAHPATPTPASPPTHASGVTPAVQETLLQSVAAAVGVTHPEPLAAALASASVATGGSAYTPNAT